MNKKKIFSLWLGPVLFLFFIISNPFSLATSETSVIGVIAWMLVWWISETVPMAVTSLLPIVLFPLLGILNIEKTCMSYGNRFVFLFLGGFIIALAMEKWQLHRRLALTIVNVTGVGANRIILGFFGASYLISMWISNTATALMMFPIATSVVGLLVNKSEQTTGVKNFATTIMLAIAYGASIGGIATLVGSPPNAAMAGILAGDAFKTNVTFFDWMKLGFPFSLLLFIISYYLLVYVIYPNRLGKFELGHDVIRSELSALSVWKPQEKRIFTIFVMTACLWMLQDPLSGWLKPAGIEITDSGVAIFSGILLFLIPGSTMGSTPILEWKDTEKLPWGVLLMFGGGLALAEGFKSSGLIDRLASHMSFADHSNVFLFVVLLCAIGLVLTALMSNLAMVNIFVPVVAVLALSLGKSPELVAIPVTIAASCDFMFPMSTPPNAIAYSSNLVRASQMFRAGIVLNLVSFLLLAGMIWIILR